MNAEQNNNSFWSIFSWFCLLFLISSLQSKGQKLSDFMILKSGLIIQNTGQSITNAAGQTIPLFNITNNTGFATTTGTDQIGVTSSWGLTGMGVHIVLLDAGGVRTSHQEFGNGNLIQMDNPLFVSHHATHVAGTLTAAGIDIAATGIAPQAHIRAYDWTHDWTELQMEADCGALLANISYGIITGWQNINDTWYWWGDVTVSTEEDYLFGFYSAQAQAYDQLAHDYPDLLMVKSAGNERNDNGPNQNESHLFFDGTNWVVSNTHRMADGANNGFDCIAHAAVAKNVLTVGAVQDIEGAYTIAEDVQMTPFSAWGPTDDGRIKPDIVANGTGLYSPTAQSDDSYASFSGTSMATPGVTATLALLQQLYLNTYNLYLRSASLKALVVHTALEAGSYPGPDYRFGWGLLNAPGAASVIDQNNTATHSIIEETCTEILDFQMPIASNGLEPLIATLVWTDKAGDCPMPSVDAAMPLLVNDLDITIEKVSGSDVYEPYVLDPANPNAAATTGNNDRDNVEKIVIPNPEPGLYIVHITHKGDLVDGKQDFSLILSGMTMPNPIAYNRLKDSLALVSLYHATDGENWTNASNWLEEPLDNWYGINVNEEGSAITSISLANNNLTGILPADIAHLTALKTLSLSGNHLYGKIPDISTLTNLEMLALYKNELSSPLPDLSNLTNLQWIWLHENQFTFEGLEPIGGTGTYIHQQTLPIFQKGCVLYVKSGGTTAINRYKWYKNGNLVQNVIGDSTFTVTQAANYYCKVSNEIITKPSNNYQNLVLESYSRYVDPSESMVIDSLALVALYNATDGQNWTNNTNWLQTPVENWYGITIGGDACSVVNIDLQSNNLQGTIPVGLAQMSNLNELNLANNQLIGTLPQELETLHFLQKIILTNNELSGTVNIDFEKLPYLKNFEVASNQFTGSVPASMSCAVNLEVIDLQKNQLSGTIPEELTHLTQLKQLLLNHNELRGTLPTFTETSLQILNIANNQLLGSVPDMSNLINLTELVLQNNHFTFEGLEQFTTSTIATLQYAPQYPLNIEHSDNLLSVNAGATTTENNTYKWFKNGVLASTIVGDNTYAISDTAVYYCEISNQIVTQYGEAYQALILTTDSVEFRPLDCDNGCVWPGDTNNDAIVDLHDWLIIGMGYGKNGIARQNSQTTWKPQSAENWGDYYPNSSLYGNLNYKHADTNGDGLINAVDSVAIVQNLWNLRDGFTTNPNYTADPTADHYLASNVEVNAFGTCKSITIDIGLNDLLPANVVEVYGIVFKVHYADIADLLCINGLQADLTTSCLGVLNNNMFSLVKNDTLGKVLHIAAVRNNQTNANCTGDPLARIIAVIHDIPDDTTSHSLTIEPTLVIKADGSHIPVAGQTATVHIPVTVKLTALLEGAYNSATGAMRTDLRTEALLPLEQPFNQSPWNYNGEEQYATMSDMPINAVDWVLVEIRYPYDNYIVVEKRAAILLSDGRIVDVNGFTDGVLFYRLALTGAYYVSLKTRNHLAVMSPSTIAVSNAQLVHNFTSDVTQASGDIQLIEIDTGKWALRAGDINGDGRITISDFNTYTTNASTINQYLGSDCNFDTAVTITDFNLYYENTSLIGIQQIRY